MNSIIILQARTDSLRLPGKALMDVGGLPMAVLAYKRATNTGLPALVVTSSDSTDDLLARVLYKHGISYYRGDLCNVLDRFVKALTGLADETIVIRLTADNVFPDGRLLDELILEFVSGAYRYLCCNGLNSGLPYGVSAELMLLGDLREAAVNCVEKFDLEHVTPYIKRKYGSNYYKKYLSIGMGHFRCTVDSLDDYLAVNDVFLNKTVDPIRTDFLNLIDLLKGSNYQPFTVSQDIKLVLGTAQLGMDYGIANRLGKPEPCLAKFLLKTAVRNGVKYIDTARSYGESESIVGEVLGDGWRDRFKVVTKLPHFSEMNSSDDGAEAGLFVDASLYKSLFELNVAKIDVMLLHSAKSMFVKGIWNRLLQHVADGRITSLGVSVQTPTELLDAIDVPEVSFVQLPLNILDWRWSECLEKISETKKHRDIKIHARSVFLQGLLLCKDESTWNRANVKSPKPIIRWLENCSRELRMDGIASLCYSYANSIEIVDGIVVGVESNAQLVENLKLAEGKLLSKDEIKYINSTRPIVKIETLNPSSWKY